MLQITLQIEYENVSVGAGVDIRVSSASVWGFVVLGDGMCKYIALDITTQANPHDDIMCKIWINEHRKRSAPVFRFFVFFGILLSQKVPCTENPGRF